MCSFTTCHVISLPQKPHIHNKGKFGSNVQLNIKNLLFKINNGRKCPKCKLWLNNGKIADDDEHYDINKNVFELSILQFESKLKGVYKCVVSTAEEPKISTAVEVIIDSDSGKMACRHVTHTCSSAVVLNA